MYPFFFSFFFSVTEKSYKNFISVYSENDSCNDFLRYFASSENFTSATLQLVRDSESQMCFVSFHHYFQSDRNDPTAIRNWEVRWEVFPNK